VGGKNNNGIDSDEPEDDSDCENEPGDYPTPQSLDELANPDISSDSSPAIILDPSLEPEPISIELKLSLELNLLESSLSRVEIPLSISSEAAQRRIRYKKTIITPKQARQSHQ